jgi:hypothetical protein
VTTHLSGPVPRLSASQLRDLSRSYAAGARSFRAGGDLALAERCARRAVFYRDRLASKARADRAVRVPSLARGRS